MRALSNSCNSRTSKAEFGPKIGEHNSTLRMIDFPPTPTL